MDTIKGKVVMRFMIWVMRLIIALTEMLNDRIKADAISPLFYNEILWSIENNKNRLKEFKKEWDGDFGDFINELGLYEVSLNRVIECLLTRYS